MQRLLEAYPVELTLHVITPPASDVNPAPALRQSYSIRDAQQMAAYWDLEFPGKKDPDAGMVRDIGTALVRERPAREQLVAAMELTTAMWTVDKKAPDHAPREVGAGLARLGRANPQHHLRGAAQGGALPGRDDPLR